jgi:dihydroorotase
MENERRLIIQGGRVLDPASGHDEVADVLIEDGRIAAIGAILKETTEELPPVLNASGKVVCPGLVDLHAHLREPGFEHAETIETGARAAAAGGFTSVCCMPNTHPVNDNASVTRHILELSRAAPVHVHPIGAISKGMEGEELAAVGSMKEAGAVAISDNGKPIMNARLLRRAMELAADNDLPVMNHCEDLNLSRGGSMHEGLRSTRLGLSGIPAYAEEIHVIRDLILAKTTGARLHIPHISSRGSLAFIKQAKEEGLPVSCEVTPHHLTLSDEDVTYDGNLKMKPPLRSTEDRKALIEAVKEGLIDAIVSDHAPHPGSEKMKEFSEAPFGITGFDTALALVLKALYHSKQMDLRDTLALLTSRPAEIAGIDAGKLNVGGRADLMVLDPDLDWEYDVNQTLSKSKNTPFHGWKLKGRAVATLVNGAIVWQLKS